MRLNRNLIFASGILAGTIIGAGIFSLPYVVSKMGMVLGISAFFLFAVVYCCIHIMYAELALLHEGKHQFVFFAERHLPGPLRGFAGLIVVGEMILTLAIYLVLAPSFISFAFGLSGLPAALLFWALGSIFIFVELSILGIAETLGVAGIVGIIFVVLGAGSAAAGSIALTPPSWSWMLIFLPFGPLLFSFAGRPAVTKVVEEYRIARKEKNPFSVKQAILLGTGVPFFVYLVFTLAFLRINPTPPTDPIRALLVLPPTLLVALGVMGFLTLWTSYFMIGLNIKDTFEKDLNYSRIVSAIVVLFMPLLLYVSGVGTFMSLVAFTGSVFLAFEGILIVRMWQNAFPRHPMRNASFLLYLVFLSALFYEIIFVLV